MVRSSVTEFGFGEMEGRDMDRAVPALRTVRIDNTARDSVPDWGSVVPGV